MRSGLGPLLSSRPSTGWPLQGLWGEEEAQARAGAAQDLHVVAVMGVGRDVVVLEVMVVLCWWWK